MRNPLKMNEKGAITLAAIAGIPFIGYIAAILLGGLVISTVSYFLYNTLVPLILILGTSIGGLYIIIKGITMETTPTYKATLAGIGIFMMIIGIFMYGPTGSAAFQIAADAPADYEAPAIQTSELMTIANVDNLQLSTFPYLRKVMAGLGAASVAAIYLLYKDDDFKGNMSNFKEYMLTA